MKRGRPLRQRSAKKAAADLVLAEASKERRERCSGMCEGNTPACYRGPHRGHHAHHLARRSQGGGHEVENLRWLCWQGHDWVHGHIDDARRLGLLAGGDR